MPILTTFFIFFLKDTQRHVSKEIMGSVIYNVKDVNGELYTVGNKVRLNNQ